MFTLHACVSHSDTSHSLIITYPSVVNITVGIYIIPTIILNHRDGRMLISHACVCQFSSRVFFHQRVAIIIAERPEDNAVSR